MGLFQQITNTSHLPPVGTNAENLSLDIKMTMTVEELRDHREIAKDVAAFANASGGVILVGAAEDRTRGVVGRYFPMEQQVAKQIRDAFSHATSTLCSPKPVINPVIIGCQDKFVVAVNVWPFPGQAVGVRFQTEPLCFAFPFRTGVQTIWLTAEQLPLLMVPELRRITILLDAIPTGAQVNIMDAGGHDSAFELVELRTLENVVVLRQATKSPAVLFLPIDIIRSVWKEQNSLWRMIIEELIFIVGNSAAIVLDPRRRS